MTSWRTTSTLCHSRASARYGESNRPDSDLRNRAVTNSTQPRPFPGWTSLLPHTHGGSGVLLLLDFDGTISDIVDNPDGAVLRPGNRDLLASLSERPSFMLGILSGRSLDDVRRRVAVPNLVYGGNHGLEISGPGLKYLHPAAAAAIGHLSGLAAALGAALSPIPGAHVENKTLTLTAHYRQTPDELHDRVHALVEEVAEPAVAAGRVRISSAKAAIELRPAIEWDKGRALNLIRARKSPNSLAIYIGDDTTDEAAFAAAQEVGGFGIFVGPKGSATRAKYRLDSPAAVGDALVDLSAS